MRIQPRQQLLEVWRAVARWSVSDQGWVWGGSEDRSSISDAEQLLCLLGPATEIDTFTLDQPDRTATDVLEALAALGDSVELPRRLLRVGIDFLDSYTDETGTPMFSGGSYLRTTDPTAEPTPTQLRLDIVDSYAMSIRLSLALIGFARVFRNVLSREDLLRDVAALEEGASRRLTAAMLGLLRSFAVHTFDLGSPAGETLVRTVNQGGQSFRQVVEALRFRLRGVNAGLRDLTLGAPISDDLDNPHRLFECGWSWGPVQGVPEVSTSEAAGQQPVGVSLPAPYLYFTVIAMDAVRELFAERTRLLGLLNDEQLRLARALQVRWDLTQSYWATIATFGGGTGRWPLEDIPWRTVDELESDYFTLLVSSIIVQEVSRRPASDTELGRIARVLEDLAGRARVTRRAVTHDPAVTLHSPGISNALEGTETVGGPRLQWRLADFSPQLLKSTLRVAGLLSHTETRDRVLELSDRVWDHLQQRRHLNGAAASLWDRPSEAFPDLKPSPESPSWYHTERVVEALVTAARLVGSEPIRSPRLGELAVELVAEAEHLFDQELLAASAETGPAMSTTLATSRSTLRRAREVIADKPGTAFVLASDVLRELDRLAAARLSFRGLG